MNDTKRYDHFPQLAEMVREMSPEGRTLLARWHAVMVTGLRGFTYGSRKEMRKVFSRSEVEAAQAALRSWLDVMNKVGEVLADPRPADWCCKQGMAAWPSACPQHPGSVNGVLADQP